MVGRPISPSEVESGSLLEKSVRHAFHFKGFAG